MNCEKHRNRDAEGKFIIWAFGDAHVGTDMKFGRESLAEAIRQTERFGWEIGIDVGDMSGAQGLPGDEEGIEILRQFQSLKRHNREDIYSVCGNHDRSGLKQEPGMWWRKWIDPLGESGKFSGVDPKRRKYPVRGTWERYSFRVGNMLFLMMSDINEPTQEKGRGELGGNPGGVVSGETFDWWKKNVEDNRGDIIISVHHYVLKDTTVASGCWEGMQKDEVGNWRGRYHGYKADGTPEGASHLYWVGSEPGSGAFEKYLRDNPGAVDIWIGGHTHTNPDDTYGGKNHIEKRWGTYFINAAALTKYHVADHAVPMSRFLEFEPASNRVVVKCFLHTGDYAGQGWYPKAEKEMILGKKFKPEPAG